MVFIGADTVGLRSTSAEVEKRASQLEGLCQELERLVSAVHWQGADGEAFRRSWHGVVRTRFGEAAEMLHARARLLEQNADEQDEASDSDAGSGGSNDDGWGEDRKGGSSRAVESESGHESDGFFGDLLGGPQAALWGNLGWNSVSFGLDAWGMVPGQVATAVGLPFDLASTGIGLYDAAQSFQDGELYGTVDGLVSAGVNGADSAFGVLSLIPEPHVAVVGEVGGIFTGALDMAWSGATAAAQVDAMEGGDHGGSTSRFLAEQMGVPDSALDGAEDLYGTATEYVRDKVPVLDPMIDASQSVVENAVPSDVQSSIEDWSGGASDWVDDHVPWWH
ncbi:WXG100 family type VII secretion target [Brachybacterium sp. ACRRE]|uniref:WXG100 family type VII secretion target n=1 Tax=Brachybacterium sp. ACRRE TaxID=2918184 RepID=UPI001EF1A7B9|nr:WXG100 family type VII secretion target [Brachybacterium sp. ACRRE]MCG7308566.1 WXG100 family type VII secretion target [Brachybacterium sp. ACRRE]